MPIIESHSIFSVYDLMDACNLCIWLFWSPAVYFLTWYMGDSCLWLWIKFLYLLEKSNSYYSWQRHFNICGTALEWFPSWSLQMPYKSKIVILRAKSLVSGRIKTTNNKNKNLPICFYPTYQKLLLSWRGNPAHLLGEPNLAIYIQFLTDFVLVCLSLLLIVVSHCSPSATR